MDLEQILTDDYECQYFFLLPLPKKSVVIYSVDGTIIEGNVTFLFCEKTFGGEYLQWKDKQVESPPERTLGGKSV